MVLEIQKYSRYVRRSLLNRGGLSYFILYVTSGCNSACRTCFFYQNLNRSDDLSLQEYKKISQKLGVVSVLLLSGGEPFVRADLNEICRHFINNNKIDTLSIPTNGILSDKIAQVSESLAKEFGNTVISINPSLDGMRDYHDMIRGVPGNFDRVVETIKKMEEIKRRYRNIQIIVNSVVNGDNIGEIRKLIVFLEQFNLDYHALEIMRGERKDNHLKLPEVAAVKELHRFMVERRERRIKNIFEKIIVIGSLKYIYRMKENLLEGKPWPIRCAAGECIAVVYPNGDFSLCELKKPLGNLRDNGYDVHAMLRSKEARNGVADIEDTRCSCTHICFLNASVARDWKSIFKIPFHYFKND